MKPCFMASFLISWGHDSIFLLIHSDAERLNGLWCHIINELERLDKILNRFDPHSEVSGINKHALLSYIQISKELEEILQLCQYYYETPFIYLTLH